jgi:integrase
LGEIVEKYLAAREDEFRPKSYSEVKRYLERSWKPLHKRAVGTIVRADIVGVVDDLERDSGKVAADRARTALSAFFAWAIDRGYCDSNPTMNIRARNQNGSRTRVLTESELVEVWKACLDDDHGRIVRLLILTGQRRTEIGDIAWPEINIAERQIDLPETRTKNGRAHIVPLSVEALTIIEDIPRREGRDLLFGRGAGGFSGWSKAKAELDGRIAAAGTKVSHRPSAKSIPSWTLHDLRRSFVTHINERKLAPPHVVEAIVNHVSGHLAGVAGVYNKALYLAERRQALELWGAHITALVEGCSGKVVPLKRAQ